MEDRKMSEVEDPKSPCIRQCCLDEMDICLGCFRSLNEIIDWHSSTIIEKNKILIVCCQRRKLAQKSRF